MAEIKVSKKVSYVVKCEEWSDVEAGIDDGGDLFIGSAGEELRRTYLTRETARVIAEKLLELANG